MTIISQGRGAKRRVACAAQSPRGGACVLPRTTAGHAASLRGGRGMGGATVGLPVAFRQEAGAVESGGLGWVCLNDFSTSGAQGCPEPLLLAWVMRAAGQGLAWESPPGPDGGRVCAWPQDCAPLRGVDCAGPAAPRRQSPQCRKLEGTISEVSFRA